MEAGNKKEGDNVPNQKFHRKKENLHFPPLGSSESSTKEVTIAQEVGKYRQSYFALRLHINYLEKSLEKAECLQMETLHKYEKQIRSSNEKDEIIMQKNRENKELCVQIGTKQTKIEAMSKETQRQESEIKHYKKEISALTENLEDIERELAEVTSEHNDCSNLAFKFETMKNKSDKLEKQIGDLTETMDKRKNEMEKERELVRKERETDRKNREAEMKEREAEKQERETERKEREAERKEREAERNSLLEYRKQREEIEQRRHKEIQEGMNAILRVQGNVAGHQKQRKRKSIPPLARKRKRPFLTQRIRPDQNLLRGNTQDRTNRQKRNF